MWLSGGNLGKHTTTRTAGDDGPVSHHVPESFARARFPCALSPSEHNGAQRRLPRCSPSIQNGGHTSPHLETKTMTVSTPHVPAIQTQDDTKTIIYNDAVVRAFMLASMIWGAVALLAGVFIAAQLNFFQLNFGISWLSFGRLRPLHTNAAIFAFVGNMMFAGVYHSTQRLVRQRLASDFLSWLHFWGWQLIIVAAAITLPLGLTRGKEYAELIWPINIAVALVWVVFGVNFFWTLLRRNEPTLYVAIWFYIATIITVAMLYIVNHLQIPTSWTHAYPIFGGVQDALVQWWYGHNAVAFFLTTPILGIMYYYMPKAANRPVYSYRLSVVHFWSLVFVYIWAGPHHLLNTSLPQWLQSLGMLFSLMLWAPSWGGMLNGLLTLRGAWDKLRTDPVLKFLAAGVTFYGMATFEGPLLSIKAVNALSHYTDWTIGHVHSGTLGWNGFMAAGMFYWLAPRLWNRGQLYSTKLADLHFWLGMTGILLYIASMWVSGISQGLMLNSVTKEGVLAYPNFIDALTSANFMMLTRAFGGGLYLIGFVIMLYNIGRTIAGARPVDGSVDVPARAQSCKDELSWAATFWNAPFITSCFLVFFGMLWWLGSPAIQFLALPGLILTVIFSIVQLEQSGRTWSQWYEKLLASSMPFTALTLIAVAVGGAIQIVPTVLVQRAQNIEGKLQKVYTPLELAGRDIYIREGCYNCHTQMVRPIVGEVMRYGDFSRIGESIYEHPFQWGSKRTGPDLHRVGGNYSNIWHYRHMADPRSTSPGSNMPAYPWLFKDKTNLNVLPVRIAVLRKLGVPFPERTAGEVIAEAEKQAELIAADLRAAGVKAKSDREIIALIAYLQQLGMDDSQPASQPASATNIAQTRP